MSHLGSSSTESADPAAFCSQSNPGKTKAGKKRKWLLNMRKRKGIVMKMPRAGKKEQGSLEKENEETNPFISGRPMIIADPNYPVAIAFGGAFKIEREEKSKELLKEQGWDEIGDKIVIHPDLPVEDANVLRKNFELMEVRMKALMSVAFDLKAPSTVHLIQVRVLDLKEPDDGRPECRVRIAFECAEFAVNDYNAKTDSNLKLVDIAKANFTLGMRMVIYITLLAIHESEKRHVAVRTRVAHCGLLSVGLGRCIVSSFRLQSLPPDQDEKKLLEMLADHWPTDG